MEEKTITISTEEYHQLKKMERVDKDLLEDIALGIKDILQGKIKEI